MDQEKRRPTRLEALFKGAKKWEIIALSPYFSFAGNSGQVSRAETGITRKSQRFLYARSVKEEAGKFSDLSYEGADYYQSGGDSIRRNQLAGQKRSCNKIFVPFIDSRANSALTLNGSSLTLQNKKERGVPKKEKETSPYHRGKPKIMNLVVKRLAMREDKKLKPVKAFNLKR